MRSTFPSGTLNALVFAGGMLSACGGHDGTTTPSGPPAAALAFAYILTPPPEDLPENMPVLSTLKVTPSGNLELIDRRAIENARALAADPRGRMLFVAGGGRPTSLGRHVTTYPGYIRTYSIEPSAGTVTALAERELPHSDSPRVYLQAERMVADEGTVYVTAASRGAYSWQKVVDYRFDATRGVLSDGPGFYCETWWHPHWVLPSKPYLLAEDVILDCYPEWRDDRLTAFGVFAPDPTDGRLVRIARAPRPSPAVYGGSSAAKVGNCVAVSWAKTSDDPAGGVTVYAIDPATGMPSQRKTTGSTRPTAIASSSIGLVAVTTTTTDTLLTLSSMAPDCDLVERFSIPSAPTTALAFHPSGLFLYAVQGGGVQAYALHPDGTLRAMLGFTDGLTGDLVVVPPPT
jgi:hypothetical protein